MDITKLKKVVLTILILMLDFTCSMPCPNADFQIVVGGTSFEIESIRTAVNSNGDILVGGMMRKQLESSVLSAFLYMFRTSTCEVVWKYEFSEINGYYDPVVAFSNDGNYAYMLAYS